MKKSKYMWKIMFIATGIFLVLGVGLFIVYRQRFSFQSSEKYIDLALSSIDKAYQYLKSTEIMKKLSYIMLATSLITCIIALIIKLISKIAKEKTIKKYFCTSCGSELTASSGVCPKCGH